ncbi:dTDP-glucose 4,6-dehydratase [uncultured Devosia sp.]|uniref:dTDP-glucose 4,6-dehydratase n=1 Tax=uncultured Devosia sp. TaxID=211434 RepID=UPI0035CA0AFC
MRILVTGGAGFIGSAVVRHLVLERGHEVLTVDKLTYASSLASLQPVKGHAAHHFLKSDICDRDAMNAAFEDFRPERVMHLAAESHVDRSIIAGHDFIMTNIVGTFTLLDVARRYFDALAPSERDAFRFLHVSTDEVYGSLGPSGQFREDTPYNPSSPYSASKAASDHLVNAWGRTFGLPIVISNCSNNYGPYQFPEKLIPLTILKALQGEELPVYGNGSNVRDWLHVEDHARALDLIASCGQVGERYNVGGGNEWRNIDIVRAICDAIDMRRPQAAPHGDLIRFVSDRPGHDARYAIDAGKLSSEMGWKPTIDFAVGLQATVDWYIENLHWWLPIADREAMRPRLRAVT